MRIFLLNKNQLGPDFFLPNLVSLWTYQDVTGDWVLTIRLSVLYCQVFQVKPVWLTLVRGVYGSQSNWALIGWPHPAGSVKAVMSRRWRVEWVEQSGKQYQCVTVTGFRLHLWAWFWYLMTTDSVVIDQNKKWCVVFVNDPSIYEAWTAGKVSTSSRLAPELILNSHRLSQMIKEGSQLTTVGPLFQHIGFSPHFHIWFLWRRCREASSLDDVLSDLSPC